ncbi:amino acid permease [candidate division WOR-3 bacterium]|nr:amino acid permease [candidate division WOR-3 bacterium]
MKLKKELGLIDIFCIASGAMISSGLFILPGLAFAKAGPAVIISYILAGILVIPAVLSKAELTTAMPKAGGDYFFIDRSFGPGIGTLGGISAWFSLAFKSAFALVGIGIFIELINPNITYTQIKLISAGLCIFFVALNLIGVKQAGRTQVFLVLVLIGLLIFYVFRSLPSIQVQRYTPFIPSGMGPVFATAGFVFISYGGLTKIASVAEEVKNPGRNIPLGMILSLVIITIIYVLVIFVTTGILNSSKLAQSHTPISIGARVSMGNFGFIVMAIAALLAFISTANAGIMAASRTPMAMGRDSLLPAFFGKVVPRFGTPHYSILFTGGFMICVILFLDLERLVKAASSLKLLLFMFSNLSVISMRESKIRNYQPKFRSPLYPWMQILGTLGCGYLLVQMGTTALFTTFFLVVGGLGWYLLYSRPKVSRESALIYVIKRITSKDLTRGLLGAELREVLRERDEVVEDRFDHIIRECEVLDLKESLSLEKFLKIASNSLAKRLGMEENILFNQLLEREKESSTVIGPGFAIPHITIEGENKFEVLLARCKDGIIFSPSLPPIHTVFVLVGSRDERNFHLRALGAIAQIVREANFDKDWLSAQNPEELRDIVLLGERKRHTI